MLTLIVSHYIYLNRDERYTLFNGNTVETVGVSVPVWFEKGSTSEPAREIFCKYKITNIKNHKIIKVLKDGYEINLPQSTTLINKLATTNDSKQLENLKKIFSNFDRSLKLLDAEDGGAEWLEFKQYDKMKFKKKNVEVVHSVEIKDIRILEKTLA